MDLRSLGIPAMNKFVGKILTRVSLLRADRPDLF